MNTPFYAIVNFMNTPFYAIVRRYRDGRVVGGRVMHISADSWQVALDTALDACRDGDRLYSLTKGTLSAAKSYKLSERLGRHTRSRPSGK